MRYIAVCSATVLGVIAFQGNSAHALSMHECSAKYQAAKTAGMLNGMKWNEFRKTECGAEATAAPAPATAAAPAPAPAPTAHALSMRECSAKYQAAKAGGRAGAATQPDTVCRAGRDRERSLSERHRSQIFQ
jgi:hypothetical protein